MLLHHVITLLLVFFSWQMSYHRVGSVIMLLMDFSDPYMEIAKAFLYCGHPTIADLFFATFSGVFFITRNFFFPFYIVYPGITNSNSSNGVSVPGKPFFVPLLFILQGLFLFWGFLIVRMAVNIYILGTSRADIRDEDAYLNESKTNGKEKNGEETKTNGKEKNGEKHKNGENTKKETKKNGKEKDDSIEE